MTSKCVVVLGASGFVETTLTDRLLKQDGVEVRAVIHGTASAWRLARLDIPLLQEDVATARHWKRPFAATPRGELHARATTSDDRRAPEHPCSLPVGRRSPICALEQRAGL
jgi:nucleoside-diphosphate-sugar epimerase